MTPANPATALIMVLDQQLMAASHAAKSAYEASLAGNQNLAIGTLLPAERHCQDAVALLRVILSLHREAHVSQAGGAQ